jgi:hypothetical protein
VPLSTTALDSIGRPHPRAVEQPGAFHGDGPMSDFTLLLNARRPANPESSAQLLPLVAASEVPL